MYLYELEIKSTTVSNTSVSYLDLLLSIGGTVNFTLPYNITSVTTLISISQTFRSWVAIFHLRQPMASLSKLIRYARSCSSYRCFILRVTRLSNKLREQRYVKERLKSSLRKFHGRYGDLIKQHEAPLSQIILNDILLPKHMQWQPSTNQTIGLLLDIGWFVLFLYQIGTILPNSTFYRIMRDFYRAFATGVAYR